MQQKSWILFVATTLHLAVKVHGRGKYHRDVSLQPVQFISIRTAKFISTVTTRLRLMLFSWKHTPTETHQCQHFPKKLTEFVFLEAKREPKPRDTHLLQPRGSQAPMSQGMSWGSQCTRTNRSPKISFCVTSKQAPARGKWLPLPWLLCSALSPRPYSLTFLPPSRPPFVFVATNISFLHHNASLWLLRVLPLSFPVYFIKMVLL